jgi:hypothetical protein
MYFKRANPRAEITDEQMKSTLKKWDAALDKL